MAHRPVISFSQIWPTGAVRVKGRITYYSAKTCLSHLPVCHISKFGNSDQNGSMASIGILGHYVRQGTPTSRAELRKYKPLNRLFGGVHWSASDVLKIFPIHRLIDCQTLLGRPWLRCCIDLKAHISHNVHAPRRPRHYT